MHKTFMCLCILFASLLPLVSYGSSEQTFSDTQKTILFTAYEIGKQYSIPNRILPAIVLHESSAGNNLVSGSGKSKCYGVGQMKASTAKLLMDQNPDIMEKFANGESKNIPKMLLTNHEFSIALSAVYLRQLYEQFGDWNRAIAAYNVGEGAAVRLKAPESQMD